MPLRMGAENEEFLVPCRDLKLGVDVINLGKRRSQKKSQPSHRLTGFSTRKGLAFVWLRATRHGYEKQKP
jgi:hypothetical protein